MGHRALQVLLIAPSLPAQCDPGAVHLHGLCLRIGLS
jgi:hypothetical protein